jgi:hypothetical protein
MTPAHTLTRSAFIAGAAARMLDKPLDANELIWKPPAK